MERATVSEENAPKFLDWLAHRGGIAQWRSVNLSNPGGSWSSPALTKEGLPTPKPTWEADSQPERIITSAEEIDVVIDKEVKRFRIAVRQGSQGLSLKCTDASSRKIRAAVAKAGEGSYHVFDFMTQEAVIMSPEKVTQLSKWVFDNASIRV